MRAVPWLVRETRPPGELVADELILIVEDDARSSKLLRDLLQFHGYQTLEATSGEAGVELARSSRPQLILMDIRLPGIDGEEALRRIRRERDAGEIPILAVTASVMRGDEQRLRETGFDGYIPKPIDVVAFPGIVRTYLDRGRVA